GSTGMGHCTGPCSRRLALGVAGKPAGGADEDPATGAAGCTAADLRTPADTAAGPARGTGPQPATLGRRPLRPGAGQHGPRAPAQPAVQIMSPRSLFRITQGQRTPLHRRTP